MSCDISSTVWYHKRHPWLTHSDWGSCHSAVLVLAECLKGEFFLKGEAEAACLARIP